MHQHIKDYFSEGRMLLVDKPLSWTSHDVVAKIRNAIRIQKVGHAGTLDPLATGLLIICTGKFTKKINEYMAREKEYTGTITLGAVTPTYDLESEPENFKDASDINRQLILEKINYFIGDIKQVPPAFSAVKQKGKPVYLLARKGKEVVLEPRNVHISTFEITSAIGLGTAHPILSFKVVCSTGTYIRSLAHDLGRQLGCGAYLSSLCRTRIGEFELTKAKSLEHILDWIKEMKESERVIDAQ
jgi:tRNA pseudouridine55 synthase